MRCEAIKADGDDCQLAATHIRIKRSGAEEFYCGRHAAKYGARHTIDEDARNDRLVSAAREAIDVLMAPFSEGDYIPGNVEDAVAALRRGLGASAR